MVFHGGVDAVEGKNDDDGDVRDDEEGVSYVPEFPEVDSAAEAEGAGGEEGFGFHVVVFLEVK